LNDFLSKVKEIEANGFKKNEGGKGRKYKLLSREATFQKKQKWWH
jgi:hypothetical protein